MQYDKLCVDAFLKNQLKLLPEIVAETEEEAESFLEDVCAYVCADKDELREYLEEECDISDIEDDDLVRLEEVFPLADGRYLVVEG